MPKSTEDKRGGYRLVVSTAIIASMLAYLAVRAEVAKLMPHIEPVIAATLFASALASITYLYLFALGLKYSKSAIIPKIDPKHKTYFFDLSIDLMLLTPLVFYIYFVYSALTPLVNNDSDFSLKGTIILTILSIVMIRPFWKIVIITLKNIYGFTPPKVSREHVNKLFADNTFKLFVVASLVAWVVPTTRDAYLVEIRAVITLILSIIALYLFLPAVARGVFAGLKEALIILIEITKTSIEFYRQVGISVATILSSPVQFYNLIYREGWAGFTMPFRAILDDVAVILSKLKKK